MCRVVYPWRWLYIAALICLGAVTVVLRPLPTRFGELTPGTEFSLRNSRDILAVLAQQPHPTGSREQERVREYIKGWFKSHQIEVQEQVSDATVWMAGAHQSAHVHNLLAIVPGSEPNLSAVALAAHYDTVQSSPGAGDDGAAVAALMETARALAHAPKLRRSVYVLLTDGEEQGLIGAQAFVNSHPLRKHVGLIINFEARGSAGPELLYQTSNGNGPLIARVADAAPYPHANSLISDLSKVLPNDADSSIFMKAGIPGLAYAFVEGFEHYHRSSDSLQNLDSRSLAHCGLHAYHLARNFGNAGSLNSGRFDRVYFDLWGRWLIHYPEIVAQGLGTLCLLGWLVLFRREIRARNCTGNGVLQVAKVQILVSVMSVIIPIMLQLLRQLIIDEEWLTRRSALFGLSDFLVVLGVSLPFYKGSISTRRLRDRALGSIAPAVAVAVFLGWLMPQSSAPWQWVCASALLVWSVEPLIARWPAANVLLQHGVLAVAAITILPAAHTAFLSAGPTLQAIPVALCTSFMGLFMVTLVPKATMRLLPVATVTCGLGLVLMLVTALTLRTPLQQPSSYVYALDPQQQTALYIAEPSPRAPAVAQGISTRQPLVSTFTPAQRPWQTAHAPVVQATAPGITVEPLPGNEHGRQVRLTVARDTEASCVRLWQPSGEPIRTLRVNQQPVDQMVRFSPKLDELGFQVLSGIRQQRVWQLNYCGLRERPLAIEFAIPKGRVHLRVVTESPVVAQPDQRQHFPGRAPGADGEVRQAWLAQEVQL